MRSKEEVSHKNIKILRSPDYNFIFNKDTGFFARWGKTIDDDPQYIYEKRCSFIK